ncbi:hypothetical protein KGM_200077 [Danaus plexippus plexippus]|uniref:Uncharacterized protein n=1 Tax=Danaus plexippus plexippus TaxID=278856 RepID=A0A212F0T9_DANPL|nr:hypothetical protein KGM_200077 [Danaus plexippus plexippus]
MAFYLYAILLTDFVCSISSGFLLAFPSVLNPAILSPNSTDIKATSAQASSIDCCCTAAGSFVQETKGENMHRLGIQRAISEQDRANESIVERSQRLASQNFRTSANRQREETAERC